MNYRHAYHAGNFADVVKHTVLLQLLNYLQKKPTPYCYMDTHAGAGRYDLATDIAQKTGEAFAGIERLLAYPGAHPESVAQYIQLVKSCSYYPGSPSIAAAIARVGDSVILNEKHAATFLQLKENFKGARNVSIHQRDAYEFLPAILPPTNGRGLVLIDPAFEDEQEMEYLRECLQKCFMRWPQGMYLIWLPIVGRSDYHTRDLQYTGFKDYLTIEFNVNRPSSETQGLIGCSLLLINPPWQIETVLEPLLAHLWEILHQDPQSQWRMG